MKLILIGVVAPATLWAQTPTDAVRRIATTSRLAAEEYALGVVDGKIVLAPELEEARLFFGEAKKSVAALPPAPRVRADAKLDSLLAIIDRLGPADSLQGAVERMIAGLSAELGVTLAERPDAPPSLIRGEAIYRSTCSSCHGARGSAAA